MAMKKVLVVDDSPPIVEVVREVLKTLKVRVQVAFSGKEALKKVKKFRPDLMLLDVNLPDIDGFTVCRQIRQDPLVRGTPIIMLTAYYTGAVDRVKGLDLGADDYIVKPFDMEVLLGRVTAVLRRSDPTHKPNEED